MKTNKIIRTISKIDSGIFKALNMNYGFDFEKSFDVYKIETPFTLKKLEKIINAKYLPIGWNSEVVILLHFPETMQHYRRNSVVAVEAIGTGASDFNVGYEHRTRSIDYFWCKGDFNDARRDEDVEAFVVVQSKRDLSGRYVRPSEITTYTERDMTRAGETYQQGRYINGERVYTQIERFDKSGYYVQKKRAELNAKAKERKADKQKSEFLATDNTAKVEEMKKRVETSKEIIIERLKAATTREDINTIRSSALYELYWAFDYLTTLIKGEKEKTFGSIDTFNSYVKDVEQRTSRIMTWEF